MTDNKGKVIGFLLRDKKRQEFHWDSTFIPAAAKRGFKVIPFDGSNPDEHIDILIAKYTDYLPTYETNENSKRILDFFAEYERTHKTPVIDPLDSQRIVSSRFDLCEKLQAMDDDQIENPNFAIVHDEAELTEILKKFRFPMMIKAIVACGCAESHQMSITFNEKQVRDTIQYPAFLQEYFNHDGIIYKCSAIGTCHVGYPRPSTKNFNLSNDNPIVSFNSQSMADITDTEAYKLATPLSDKLVQAASKLISESINFSLYGFDLIVNAETKKAAIIDINFFPSLRTVTDPCERILDLVEARLAQREGEKLGIIEPTEPVTLDVPLGEEISTAVRRASISCANCEPAE